MYICIKIKRLELIPRIIETNDLATYLLVLSFLLLAATRYLYPRQFLNVLLLPLNSKFFKLHGKEDIFKNPFNYLFFIFQTINVSILIFLLITNLNPEANENPWLLIQMGTLYTVFVIAKTMVDKIFANIFSIDPIIDSYLFQKLSYRNLISMLIFGVNLIFLYTIPNTGSIIWYYLTGILILNTLSVLSIYIKNRKLISSYFSYFILYLCALEISPYIILYKIIVGVSI